MNLTVAQALAHAQRVEPLDLTARIEHMTMHLDRCTPKYRAVWATAIRLTRNGQA